MFCFKHSKCHILVNIYSLLFTVQLVLIVYKNACRKPYKIYRRATQLLCLHCVEMPFSSGKERNIFNILSYFENSSVQI